MGTVFLYVIFEVPYYHFAVVRYFYILEEKIMPTIDMQATGKNIKKIIVDSGIGIQKVQDAFGFRTPQAIYKWYRGATMPTIDNLVILASLCKVKIDDIIIINK